jgi:hypothetical protein
MIEQLQSLMKALEAGSYNYPPQQENHMNLEFKITDKDTGEVLHEGLVTSWRVEISRNSGRKFSFEGIQLIKAKKEEPTHYMARAAEPPRTQYFETKRCDHVWKSYEGFMDKYNYCEKCNEKRT